MIWFNEIEPYAVEWLRNLIADGVLDGDRVEDANLLDLTPDDLDGVTRAHFFAGIGGWQQAMQLAGWPDDWNTWTASLPCQPFSSAGKQKGMDDERHLWPPFFKLVAECRPRIIVGEQVPSAIRLGWLDRVFDELEEEGYACGAVVLPACGVGAPHIRQRLWWVAHAGRGDIRDDGPGLSGATKEGRQKAREQRVRTDDRAGGTARGVAHAELQREGRGEPGEQGQSGGGRDRLAIDGATGGVGHDGGPGPQGHAGDGDGSDEPGREQADAGGSATAAGDACYVPCADGHRRRVNPEPGDEPLAYGLPRGMGSIESGMDELGVLASCDEASLREAKRNQRGRLTGYGNAIVPQVAAGFLEVIMDTLNDEAVTA